MEYNATALDTICAAPNGIIKNYVDEKAQRRKSGQDCDVQSRRHRSVDCG